MAAPDEDEVGVRGCPACDSVVPAARFCGHCGAELDRPVTGLRVMVRPRVYATAHREPVWLPRISSTLFPRFPGEIRKPFRIGLILVAIGILIFSALRLNAPLGVTATIGWPLLFLLYVWQSDVFRDVPLRILGIATALGIGLGVGWWLAAGEVLATSYGVSTASSLQLTRVIHTGFLITLGGAALMLVPAFVTRLVPMPVRESLDGFVIGAAGALWYSTAATTTITAPSFVQGLSVGYSAGRMLQDAVTYGIVNPIVTTAAGGLVGLSLWFRPDRRPGRHPKRARGMLTAATLLAVGIYAAVWFVDAQALPRAADLLAKLTLAALALVTVRAAVQVALLHEAPDPATEVPLLCVHCEKVVPDLTFCVSCGVAARASSRTSRRLRHEDPPVRELSTR